MAQYCNVRPKPYILNPASETLRTVLLVKDLCDMLSSSFQVVKASVDAALLSHPKFGACSIHASNLGTIGIASRVGYRAGVEGFPNPRKTSTTLKLSIPNLHQDPTNPRNFSRMAKDS